MTFGLTDLMADPEMLCERAEGVVKQRNGSGVSKGRKKCEISLIVSKQLR
jgi:hypothetical protein